MCLVNGKAKIFPPPHTHTLLTAPTFSNRYHIWTYSYRDCCDCQYWVSNSWYQRHKILFVIIRIYLFSGMKVVTTWIWIVGRANDWVSHEQHLVQVSRLLLSSVGSQWHWNLRQTTRLTTQQPSTILLLLLLQPSSLRGLATPCTSCLHLARSSVYTRILSNVYPVHWKMLSIHVVFGLPLFRDPVQLKTH